MMEEYDLCTSQAGDDVHEYEDKECCSEPEYDRSSKHDEETLKPLKRTPNFQKKGLDKEEKYGHRRVHVDGGVSYKKISSSVIIDFIQIGIRKSVGGMALNPERDVLMKDFMTVESTTYTSTDEESNDSKRTPSFVFKTYAPIAFRHFRDLFGIKPNHFVTSFCDSPLIELPNPGASGSLLYLTGDDEFILKTVQHKEADFLQKLLPGYYLNLNQNPYTLLPKFFGLYCCQRDSKNVRLVAMNNVLPYWIKIHQKYDLKGSTYNRSASKKELEKDSPSYKDLDFIDHHPNGIFLETEIHKILIHTIQRDCRVLESFQIIDYSLLLGVHNLDQAKRENLQYEEKETTNQGSKKETGDGDKQLNLIRSKIDEDCEKMAVTKKDDNVTGEDESKGAIKKSKESLSLKGIPARQSNGENLLLYVGIIDILQSYKLTKRLEHVWKSIVQDRDSISVQNPSFYAQRFQEFMSNSVFKSVPSSPKSNRRKSVPKLKPEEKRLNN